MTSKKEACEKEGGDEEMKRHGREIEGGEVYIIEGCTGRERKTKTNLYVKDRQAGGQKDKQTDMQTDRQK